MYQLYYSPGACSLAVHAALIHLEQPFELVNVSLSEGRHRTPEYLALNPRGQVPLLIAEGRPLRESAAILMHLLDTHGSPLLPREGWARAQALEWLCFCNSGLHQAYSTYFFLSMAVKEAPMREEACRLACRRIQKLWDGLEAHLDTQPWLCGAEMTIADILLAVIANWSPMLKPGATLGPQVKNLCGKVAALPYFAKALKTEGIEYGV